MTELADTSAWVWSRRPGNDELRHTFDLALVDGEIATCDMVRLELLYSARNISELVNLRDELAALPDCPLGEQQWHRALWVYEQPAAQGGTHQRSVKHPTSIAGMVVVRMGSGREHDRLAREAKEAERLLADTANSGDPAQHAGAMLGLGVIRLRLGELEEAERLIDAAATAFGEVGSPRARQASMGARLTQLGPMMAAGRFDQALESVERLVEQSGGFPVLDEFPAIVAPGLSSWMSLLERAQEHERLYAVSELALARLNPDGPPVEREVFLEALGHRAASAQALGFHEEAIETYETAIASCEADDLELVGRLLANLMQRQARLFDELDSNEDAAGVYTEVLERFAGRPRPGLRR